MAYIIYQIEHKVSGKRYIGYTGRSLEWRVKFHLYAAMSKKTRSAIHAALRKYPLEDFAITVLVYGLSKDMACLEERRQIAALGTMCPQGYNMTPGGDGFAGGTHSSEARAKMSRVQTALNADPARRAAASAFHKGKPMSDEQRRVRSDAAKRAWAKREVRERQLAAIRNSAATRLPELRAQAAVALPLALAASNAVWSDPAAKAARLAKAVRRGPRKRESN